MALPWYKVHDNLTSLALWLMSAEAASIDSDLCIITDMEKLQAFYEKPWKYENEWTALTHGIGK